MSQAFDDSALGQLFTEARTHNGWKDQSIPEETLRELYDLHALEADDAAALGRGRPGVRPRAAYDSAISRL